ncbi:20638_t:CDS:2, partial [Racocetra persica]
KEKYPKPMSVHNYFNREPCDWNITDFLNECELELFRDKIGCYLTSLENIIATGNNDERCKRAKFLYDQYKKACIRSFLLTLIWGRDNLYALSDVKPLRRPGGIENRENRIEIRTGPSIHLHNPIFTENPLVGTLGSINGGTFNLSEESKRKNNNEHEKNEQIKQSPPKKRTKIEDYFPVTLYKSNILPPLVPIVSKKKSEILTEKFNDNEEENLNNFNQEDNLNNFDQEDNLNNFDQEDDFNNFDQEDDFNNFDQ